MCVSVYILSFYLLLFTINLLVIFMKENSTCVDILNGNGKD